MSDDEYMKAIYIMLLEMYVNLQTMIDKVGAK